MTRLFFLGAYETNVASALNPNMEEPASLFLAVNSGGSSRRFFRTVPTSPKLRARKSHTRSKDVKTLSVTTVLPASSRSVRSNTTLFPSPVVRTAPWSVPRYGCIRRQYAVFASQRHQNFSPYLAGFDGMYCLKLQRPRNDTERSKGKVGMRQLHTRHTGK